MVVVSFSTIIQYWDNQRNIYKIANFDILPHPVVIEDQNHYHLIRCIETVRIVPYSAAYITPGINQETWLRLSSIPEVLCKEGSTIKGV